MSLLRQTVITGFLIGGTMIGAPAPAHAEEVARTHLEKPYRMEAIPGSTVKRIVFTQKAAQRIDVRTGQISQDGRGRLIAPYAAVFYDLKGATWVYTNPEPLTFIRHKVIIVSVEDDKAVLTEGPPDGTHVVTLGVAELYGTERGVGH